MDREISLQTPMALHNAGVSVLVKELGAVDAMRFIRLFDNGYGDYTKERHTVLDGLGVDDIFAELRQA